MKSKIFNVTGLAYQIISECHRFNTPGDIRDDLVHSCKYQELKVMCHLPDIHNNTILKHISKRVEVQGTTFNNPRALPAHAES